MFFCFLFSKKGDSFFLGWWGGCGGCGSCGGKTVFYFLFFSLSLKRHDDDDWFLNSLFVSLLSILSLKKKKKKWASSLVELRRLGRALERERRRRAGRDDGRHRVEVAGADLALVLGRGVAARLGGELGLLWLVVVVGGCCCCCGGDEMRTRMIENKEKLEKNSKTRKTKKKKKLSYRLQLRVGRHAPRAVRLGQLEHPVVERVESRQGNKLELVAQGANLLLEGRDLGLVHRAAPVERRRAVVGEELPGELRVDGRGELAGLLEVRGRGLDPEEVGVGGVGEAPSKLKVEFFFF